MWIGLHSNFGSNQTTVTAILHENSVWMGNPQPDIRPRIHDGNCVIAKLSSRHAARAKVIALRKLCFRGTNSIYLHCV
jgi:hypothetical protein